MNRYVAPFVVLLVATALLPTRAAPDGGQRTHLPLVVKALPPAPTATPTPPPTAPGDWRGRVNYYRARSGLPPVGDVEGRPCE